MSFLNSVLSSIETGDRSKIVLPAPSSKPQQPATTNAASVTHSAANSASPSLKRKNEAPQAPAATKAQRVDSTLSSRPSAIPPTSGLKQLTVQPMAVGKPSSSAASAERSGSHSTVPAAAAAADRPPTAPPKKGSYKEIMARAQAAKQAQSDIGQIKHKPVAKLSRRERQAQEIEATKRAQAQNKDKFGQKHTPVKPVSAGPSMPKEKPKTTEPSYSGTMRPANREPAYQGTGKFAGKRRAPGAKHSHSAGASRAGEGRYRYASYSDEELDEDGDEEDGSDESDDMEGGGFDELEREEEESLRAARREDEAARRQEEKHRQEKLARKKKLADLAAAAKAKKG